MKKKTRNDPRHGADTDRPQTDQHTHHADPHLGPTNPVYEEYDQGSQGPPNKPGQYDHRDREEPSDTLGEHGGQGPGQGRGANPGEVRGSRSR